MSKLPINTAANINVGSFEKRESVILSELAALKRNKEQVEEEARVIAEREAKRARPPDEFLPEAVAASNSTYIGVAQFSVPVVIRKGTRPQPKFYIVDDKGDMLDNPLSAWHKSIAFLDSRGWLCIWHQRSGEVIEVPPHNIAGIKRLDKKHIDKLYVPKGK